MAESGLKSTSIKGQFEGDNILLGLLLITLFCALIPFADALMKLLTSSVTLLSFMLIRYSIQVLITLPIMLWQRRGFSHISRLSRITWWRLFARALANVAAITCMFFALTHMPLADTTAIAFIFPLLMLFIGHYWMGEHVGPYRFTAAIVGFIGTLLVIQPNFIDVGMQVFWPMGVAVTFAMMAVLVRQMSRDIDPVSIQVVSGSFIVLMLVLTAIFFDGTDIEAVQFVMPQVADWPLLVGAGLIGTTGQMLMTFALRYAPSSTLAPMQYLEIPFATLIGWLIFSDLPNLLATLGILITIGAGLFIIYRERRSA